LLRLDRRPALAQAIREEAARREVSINDLLTALIATGLSAPKKGGQRMPPSLDDLFDDLGLDDAPTGPAPDPELAAVREAVGILETFCERQDISLDLDEVRAAVDRERAWERLQAREERES